MDGEHQLKLLAYTSIMSEAFPFKIQIKENEQLNSDSHAHDYFQICYVLKGTCLHHAHGKRVSLVKGDLFSIPPMYGHMLEALPDQEAQVVHIDFLPSLLDRHMAGLLAMDSFVDFAFIQPFVQFQDNLLPKLNLSYEGQLATEQLIAGMMGEFLRQDSGFPLMIKSDLQKLLVIAGREFLQYSQHDGERQLVSQHREHFEQALRYIDTCYRDPVRLQDAASKAAMSPSYFSTIFKLMKGMTFVDYLNEIRLNEAVRMLKEHPDWSVERISAEAGFNHLTHFYRMFKRKTGVTPAQYRNN
ncbi:hypothetical protein MU1_12890 [Paenibacillus glycanilyticus]|uniref:HTH araC/xylS-type domain-containing protein n=1 Tax=Paenibacillus glycanilyticus TaxID=126569 RepID=A0ABQ6G8V9_9BACL|nr:hypothetical protein MU1_12890 [Paenibacillus glycanilyticus]